MHIRIQLELHCYITLSSSHRIIYFYCITIITKACRKKQCELFSSCIVLVNFALCLFVVVSNNCIRCPPERKSERFPKAGFYSNALRSTMCGPLISNRQIILYAEVGCEFVHFSCKSFIFILVGSFHLIKPCAAIFRHMK